jgi:beta-phosphoglucomutase-like phosphatase (HAD superfamily)
MHPQIVYPQIVDLHKTRQEPSMNLPQAIIFDMDGLMINTEPIYHQAWKQAAQDLGYTLTDDRYVSLVGQSNADAEAVFLSEFGEDFPLQDFQVRWAGYWEEMISTTAIAPKPGLLELLDWLEFTNIPKAVGTSSIWKEAQLSLTAANIRHRFAHIITVDQAGRGKPAPDIFLMAAQALAMEPGQCLVLEDSIAGVKAASAAGIPVIMVPDLQAPSEEAIALAYAVLPSLHEVKNILASL